MLIIKMHFGLLCTPLLFLFLRAFAPFMESISPMSTYNFVFVHHPNLSPMSPSYPNVAYSSPLSAPPPPLVQSSSPHSGFTPNIASPEAPSLLLLTLIPPSLPLPLVCLSTAPDAESSTARYSG